MVLFGSREPDLRFHIDHEYTAPGRARRAVEPWLAEPGDPVADDVTLAVSEMVTNVVFHTAGGGELRLWDPRPDVPLRIEVEDTDPHLPGPVSAPGLGSDGGYGLAVLERIADGWGAFPTGLGKVVWAEFDRIRRSS